MTYDTLQVHEAERLVAELVETQAAYAALSQAFQTLHTQAQALLHVADRLQYGQSTAEWNRAKRALRDTLEGKACG